MTLYDVIQANRKDLQRFLGLNDDNEMVSKDLNKQYRREKMKFNLTKNFRPRSTFAMFANRRSRILTTGGGPRNQVQFCQARC